MASAPNQPTNFAHPVCGTSVTSMTAVADRQPGPGRQVGLRQVEVDVQLVAGERHPLRPVGHELGGPGVHDVELHLGVGGAVRRALAAPLEPPVADEADLEVQLPLGSAPRARRPGAAYDEGEGALVGWGRPPGGPAPPPALPCRGGGRGGPPIAGPRGGGQGVVLGIEVTHDADAASPAVSATAVLRCGMLAGHARAPLGGSPVSDFEEYVAGRGPALVAFAVLLTGRDDEARRLAQNALGRALARWESVVHDEDPDAHLRRDVVTEAARLSPRSIGRARREARGQRRGRRRSRSPARRPGTRCGGAGGGCRC